MTKTSTLTLDGVSFQLPDGSLLFSDLDETFDTRHTGRGGRRKDCRGGKEWGSTERKEV
ncbi:hypothetical protein, partial [Pseudomonas aeruginosa]|uniref:hypothetical protein n=1 Tax=Pseudomonas aeruginosa TaxID=287 RepID=UPI003981CEF7